MGDIYAFRSEIDIVAGKSTSVKRSSPGCAVRKTLADVTNIQPGTKPSIAERKSELAPNFAKDTDRLTKENEALKKEIWALKMQLAERNKITELSATELQKLGLNLQNMYQQNLQLAQANSQLLVELNSGKDKLKALNHEIGCMKGLLNAKTLALKDVKKAVDCRQTCNKAPTTKSEAAVESSHTENTTIKQSSINTRRLSKVSGQSVANDTNDKEKAENERLSVRRKSSRFKSEEPASTDDLLKPDDVKSAANATADKEKSENKRLCVRRQSSRLYSEEPATTEDKRLCVRRQSSRFKSEEPASTEDLFELDDIKLPLHPQVGDSNSGLSDNRKDAAVRNSTGSISIDERRMSFGRPSRRAAAKVQSYKEVPLNVKMRRSN